MKKILLLITFLFSGLYCFGQQWETFRTSEEKEILLRRRNRADKILLKGDLKKLRAYMLRNASDAEGRITLDETYHSYVWRYLVENILANTASGELPWEYAQMAIEINGKLQQQYYQPYYLCRLLCYAEKDYSQKYLAEMLGALLDTDPSYMRKAYQKTGWTSMESYSNCKLSNFDDFVLEYVVNKGKIDILKKLEDQDYRILDHKEISKETYEKFPELLSYLIHISANKVTADEESILKFLTDFPEKEELIKDKLEAYAQKQYSLVENAQNYLDIRKIRDLHRFQKIYHIVPHYFVDFDNKEKEIYEKDVKKLEDIKNKVKEYIESTPISIENASNFSNKLLNIYPIKYIYYGDYKKEIMRGFSSNTFSAYGTYKFTPKDFFIEYFIYNYADNPIDIEKKALIAGDLYQINHMVEMLKKHFYYELKLTNSLFSSYKVIDRSLQDYEGIVMDYALRFSKMPNYVLDKNDFRESIAPLLEIKNAERKAAVATFNARYDERSIQNNERKQKCIGCEIPDFYLKKLYQLGVDESVTIYLENKSSYEISHKEDGWHYNGISFNQFKSLNELLSEILNECEKKHCR